MTQNYYDEFVKLPLDEMTQEMEDMTFLYNETHVPKKRYKERLSVAMEEMIESDVETNLIATHYRTLEKLEKQSAKWFFRALLCSKVGVRPSAVKPSKYQALEPTYVKFIETREVKTVSSEWLNYFENINKCGACYIMKQSGRLKKTLVVWKERDTLFRMLKSSYIWKARRVRQRSQSAIIV